MVNMPSLCCTVADLPFYPTPCPRCLCAVPSRVPCLDGSCAWIQEPKPYYLSIMDDPVIKKLAAEVCISLVLNSGNTL